MRNFYRLTDDLYIKGRWQLDGPIDDELRNENEFWQGEKIELRGILKAPLWRLGNPLDFTMTVSEVPVFSPRIVAILRPIIGESAQFFPLHIEGYVGFHVLNPIVLLNCLNERTSEFTKWTVEDGRPEKAGHYQMVTRLRIDPDLVPQNIPVFRLNAWRIPLIVSQAFVDAILPLNPTGIKLELVT